MFSSIYKVSVVFVKCLKLIALFVCLQFTRQGLARLSFFHDASGCCWVATSPPHQGRDRSRLALPDGVPSCGSGDMEYPSRMGLPWCWPHGTTRTSHKAANTKLGIYSISQHLVRMSPKRLPRETFPAGKRPQGRPRTRWRDYISEAVLGHFHHLLCHYSDITNVFFLDRWLARTLSWRDGDICLIWRRHWDLFTPSER